MGTYKVIQDIEAEDKLLGPLTLKQFIFAAIAVAFAFVAFFIASRTTIYAAIPFLPFILVPAILAAPLGRDQPTDVWLAAQIRFFLKPRKRIWDQSGIKELVTITVPKKIEHFYTDGLSQQEVKSRLNALADTIDSRGWAVKNVDLNLYSTPAVASNSTDRLVDLSSLPQSVPEADISAADDILDPLNNPVAQQLDAMVKQSGQEHKSAAIEKMQAAMHRKPKQQTKNDYSFMDQPANGPANLAVFKADPVVSPHQNEPNNTFLNETKSAISEDEKELLKKIKKNKKLETHTRNPHHKTIKTPEELEEEARKKKRQEKQEQSVTTPRNPDNIELARNASDLKISTVAGLAKNKQNQHEGEIRIQH